MWKLSNAEEFVQDFIISKTTGIIQRYDNQVVPITYIACRAGVIAAKMLTIHVNVLIITYLGFYMDELPER